MAASALSAILGFGREIVTAHYFGTRSEVDAFLNASTVPTVLFGVFNGALVAALVPTFSDYISLGRVEEASKLGSTVLNALLFVTTALAGLGWLLAPYFVPVVAHGFPPAEQALVVEMVRWLMPGIVATSLGGVCAALLNANHRFLATAIICVAANLVTIGVVVALHRDLGIFALVLGSVLGLFAQLLVLIPSMLRHHLYRLALDLRHPGLARTWALLLPVVVGSGAAQINIAFDRYFASTLSAGSTASLGYTTKLTYLPITIVAMAIATVTFPLIAGQFASSNRAGVRRSVSLALRMVSFIVIPCAAGLSALAYPIVLTLFERGAFGPTSTALCAGLVPYACVPLITTSYNTVLVRACYACKEVRSAVAGSSLAVVINIALSATWSPILGARGLLLANGASGLFLLIFLAALFWRLIGGFELKPLLSSFSRIVLASLAMVGVLYWILSAPFAPAATLVSRACYLAGLLAVGAAVYLVAARGLCVEELTITARALMQKFGQRGAPLVPATAVADVLGQDDRADTAPPPGRT
jgi:putative peptidoglycan lipid II flippase